MGLKTDGVFYVIYLTTDLVVIVPRVTHSLGMKIASVDAPAEDDIDILD